MKKLGILTTVILALSLVLAPITSSCSPANMSKLKVVTSTSLIASIVERVGGETVDVVNIIPPAQCPGHFDVKPSDIQKLADAELFLLHGWQGEQFSQELIDSANNPDLTTIMINASAGENTNWMAPPVQMAAIDKITESLCQVSAENSTTYQNSAAELKSMIEAKGNELKASLAQTDLASINVMCAEQQTGFVKWVGLNVIATFGTPDSLTPQVVKELVDKGREAKVTLIIDNLQSGQDAGAGMAEELNCTRIILSNFPGGFDNTETWEKAIEKNIQLILETIAQ